MISCFLAPTMDYVILSAIGLAMGLLGGMLGIGGSVVMIPAMTFAFGENQHLYQASAMTCNFLVAAASGLAHKKAEVLVWPVIRWLVPAGIVGIVAGVTLSNLPFFAGPRSYILARVFGGFLVYVAAYNTYRLWLSLRRRLSDRQPADVQPGQSPGISASIGLVTGLAAGLMGIGAGTVSTPLQQWLLKMPLTRAMSNSAALIVGMAWIGATHKTLTLTPGTTFALFATASPAWTSVMVACVVMPSAILGGFLGGHLMHRLPKDWVRTVFIVVVILGAVKLLSVQPG